MTAAHDTWVAGEPLTQGVQKSLSWWSPDVKVNWSGTLWELDAVEVRPRERPAPRVQVLEAPESSVLTEEGLADWAIGGSCSRSTFCGGRSSIIPLTTGSTIAWA